MNEFHDRDRDPLHYPIRDPVDRALFACRLWLHAGFIGLCAVAAGLLLWVDGKPKWLPGASLILAGVFVAAISWSRARRILERAWRVTAPVSAAMSSRGSGKDLDRSPISVSGLFR